MLERVEQHDPRAPRCAGQYHALSTAHAADHEIVHVRLPRIWRASLAPSAAALVIVHETGKCGGTIRFWAQIVVRHAGTAADHDQRRRPPAHALHEEADHGGCISLVSVAGRTHASVPARSKAVNPATARRRLRSLVVDDVIHNICNLAVALTLALGIGAATSVLSVRYSDLVAPLPLRDPSRRRAVGRQPHEAARAHSALGRRVYGIRTGG